MAKVCPSPLSPLHPTPPRHTPPHPSHSWCSIERYEFSFSSVRWNNILQKLVRTKGEEGKGRKIKKKGRKKNAQKKEIIPNGRPGSIEKIVKKKIRRTSVILGSPRSRGLGVGVRWGGGRVGGKRNEEKVYEERLNNIIRRILEANGCSRLTVLKTFEGESYFHAPIFTLTKSFSRRHVTRTYVLGTYLISFERYVRTYTFVTFVTRNFTCAIFFSFFFSCSFFYFFFPFSIFFLSCIFYFFFLSFLDNVCVCVCACTISYYALHKDNEFYLINRPAFFARSSS